MGSKNSVLHVQTEKTAYFAGNLVSGHVHLNCTAPTEGSEVVLNVVGKQSIWWSEGSPQYGMNYHEAKNEVFDVTEVLHDFGSEAIPAGQYSFPFSFKLPSNLPGSVKLKLRSGKAEVEYKLKASVRRPRTMGFKTDLKHSQELHVMSVLTHAIKPTVQTEDQDLKGFAGKKKGTTHIACTVDKDAYTPNETATLTCAITNDSETEFKEINVILEQKVVAFGKREDRMIPEKHTICSATFPGFEAGALLEKDDARKMQVHLPKEMIASTNTNHIECNYRFVVELVPKGAFMKTVRTKIPVEIYQPQPPQPPSDFCKPNPHTETADDESIVLICMPPLDESAPPEWSPHVMSPTSIGIPPPSYEAVEAEGAAAASAGATAAAAAAPEPEEAKKVPAATVVDI